MRIGDSLFFSPKYLFRDLDFTNPDQIALAFQDRVEGFYFLPAERLIASKDAFAAGLIIFAGVEFLARVSSESEPSKWLADNLTIDAALMAKTWEYFRHGLSHEGRVKGSAQFSFETASAVAEIDGLIVVNPELLLQRVRNAFQERCAGFDAYRKELTATRLARHFEREARAVRI